MMKVLMLALVTALTVGAFRSSHALGATRSSFEDHFRNEPFQFDPGDEDADDVHPSEGHQAPLGQVLRFQDKLMFLADYYGKLDYIPYIWGGGNIGKKEICQECRKCALQKATGIKSRLSRCRACQSCGIDCSHFVNTVYNQAGLNYPYASTAELRRLRPEDVAGQYNLLDMGKDVRVVQPGDLLVYKNHVIMALGMRGQGRGDFIHATRFADHRQTGGIKLERNRLLSSFRGKLVRILRHRKFFEANSPLLSQEARPLHPLDQWSPFASRFMGPLGPEFGFIQR